MCNSICSSIVSGTTKLVKNTVFPAAFVTVGHLSKMQQYLPSLSLGDIKFSFDAKEIAPFVQTQLASAWNSATNINVTELGKSVWTNLSSIDLKGSFEILASTFSSHKVAIGTAAGIGGAATVIDAVFKRMAVIKHTNPFLRAGVSLAIASALTLHVAKNNLGLEVDPQILMDIAIKILVVGLMAKTATTTTRVAFTGLRGTSDWFSWGVRGICNGAIGVSNLLDWGSFPTKIESAKEPKRSKEPTKELKPSNGHKSGELTSPTKAVVDKRRGAHREDEDLQEAGDDLEETSAPKTPARKKGTPSNTPVRGEKKDDLQEAGDDLKESDS